MRVVPSCRGVRVTDKADLPTARVLERRDVGPDLMILWLERPPGFAFVVGQYCTVGKDGIERAYSIVSAPHEPRLELFIELVPREHGGHLTPLLFGLHAGDQVTLRPRAKGRFVLEPAFRDHLLFATVTGIVPYVSYLRDHFHTPAASRPARRFVAVHGASFRDEFVYDAELQALAAQHPDELVYVPTISRPADPRNHGWTGSTGRANTLCEAMLAAHALLPATTLAYACGNPGMVESVEQTLTARGFGVHMEKYWHD